MIHVFTAINTRYDVLPVWCDALRVTLKDAYTTHIYHVCDDTPPCGDSASQIPDWDIGTPLNCAIGMMPRDGIRIFLEEDVIPVRPWSLSDFPGRWTMMESSPGVLWPSITIATERGENIGPPKETAIIPQRFVREHGCPGWLPADLCEPAIAANASVVGDHFLHLDKMVRGAPEMPQKNALLVILAERFRHTERPASFASVEARPGLGDIVKSALSAAGITEERVSRAIGRPCGCGKRVDALNRLGRKLGIGGKPENSG